MATLLTTEYQKISEKYLGNSYGDTYVRLYMKYSEQNATENKSHVYYQSRVYYDGSTYIRDDGATGSVSGTSADEKSASQSIFNSGETTLCTTDAWVEHNSTTGELTVSGSAYLNFPNWGWSSTATGSGTLPTIVRTTKFPADQTMSMKETKTFTIKPANTNFMHSLKIELGDLTKWVNFGNGELSDTEIISSFTDIVFYADAILYQYFTTQTANVAVTLYTYNDDVLLGSDTETLTISTENVSVPHINLQIGPYDTNDTTIALTNDKNIIVSQYSTVLFALGIEPSAVDDTNATITSVSIDGTVYEDNATISITFTASDKSYITVEMTNSRGNTVTEQINYYKFIPYTALGGSASFSRSSTTTGGVITNVTTSFASTFYNGYFDENNTNKNTFTFKWRCKVVGTDIWTDYYTVSSTDFTYTDSTVSGQVIYLTDSDGNNYDFDYHTDYIIEYVFSDLLTTATGTQTLSQGIPVYSWDSTGFYVTNSFALGANTNTSGVYERYSVPVATEFETTFSTEGYFESLLAKKLAPSDYFSNNYPSASGTMQIDSSNISIEVDSTRYLLNTLGLMFDVGSNDYGNWIKFTNGIMICYGSQTFSSAFSNVWSMPATDICQITYPQTFTEATPSFLQATGFDNAWIGYSITVPSTTKSQGFRFYRPTGQGTTTSTESLRAAYFAIGKWK